MVTRILDSVENAAASKPKIDRFITRFAKVYTPCVVGIAVATALIPSLVTGNWHYWIYTAITFLVMSCPCALVLSIPLAFFSGIGAGSKKGILFIEGLSNLGAVVMDKTGTITEGNFQLQKVVTAGKYNENELLSMCAGCEQNSTHPIANSIVAAAKERGIQFEKPISLEEISGHGIVAEMPEGKVLCGNRKLMDKFGVTIGELKEASYGSEVFMAVNGTFAGYMLISDTIKPDAKEAIASLKKLGLHTVMLTGDSEDSANAVGKDAGIDEIYAKLLPEDKLNALKKVREAHGTVMFVGDGINDAPVLAGADVGAAMGRCGYRGCRCRIYELQRRCDSSVYRHCTKHKPHRMAERNIRPCDQDRRYDPWSCRTCQHVDGRICRHWRCHDLRAEFHSYPV